MDKSKQKAKGTAEAKPAAEKKSNKSTTDKNAAPMFAARGTHAEVEHGDRLTPKFDENGYLTAVATDAFTGDVLMVAHMNQEALAKTIETGEAHYWSRSRNVLWRKGDTTGQIQKIVDMRIDCDQDAVWIKVHVQGDGGACHVGYKSCFYRAIPIGVPVSNEIELSWREQPLPK